MGSEAARQPVWEGSERPLPPLDLQAEFQEQAAYWKGNEPETSALFSALLKEPHNSAISRAIEETTILRVQGDPEITSSRIAGIIKTSFLSYLRAADPEFSLDGLNTTKRWQKPLQKVTASLLRSRHGSSYNDLDTLLDYNLVGRDVNTTVEGRARPKELLIQSLGEERFPEGVRILDVGSSVMLCAHQLMLKKLYPISFNQVTNPTLPYQPAERKRPTADANEKLDRPSILNGFVCVDVYPIYNETRGMYDPGIIDWTKASLRPSEAKDPALMERFDGLLQEKHPDVHFVQADLSRDDGMSTLEERFPGEKFDFINLSTTMNQMTAPARAAMNARIKTLLKPGGIVYIQDFIGLPESSKPLHYKHIQMMDRWHQWGNYRGLIYDSAFPESERGWQEIFRFNDSRCDEVALRAGRLMMRGRSYPIHDLIRYA